MRRLALIACSGARLFPQRPLRPRHAAVDDAALRAKELKASPARSGSTSDQEVRIVPGSVEVAQQHRQELRRARFTQTGRTSCCGGAPASARLVHRSLARHLGRLARRLRRIWRAFGVGVRAAPISEGVRSRWASTMLPRDIVRWLVVPVAGADLVELARLPAHLPARPRRAPRRSNGSSRSPPASASPRRSRSGSWRSRSAPRTRCELSFGKVPLRRPVADDADPDSGEAFIVMTLGFAVVLALIFLSWLTDRVAFSGARVRSGRSSSSPGCRYSGHDGVDPGSSWLSEVADWVHIAGASLWIRRSRDHGGAGLVQAHPSFGGPRSSGSPAAPRHGAHRGWRRSPPGST